MVSATLSPVVSSAVCEKSGVPLSGALSSRLLLVSSVVFELGLVLQDSFVLLDASSQVP